MRILRIVVPLLTILAITLILSATPIALTYSTSYRAYVEPHVLKELKKGDARLIILLREEVKPTEEDWISLLEEAKLSLGENKSPLEIECIAYKKLLSEYLTYLPKLRALVAQGRASIAKVKASQVVSLMPFKVVTIERPLTFKLLPAITVILKRGDFEALNEIASEPYVEAIYLDKKITLKREEELVKRAIQILTQPLDRINASDEERARALAAITPTMHWSREILHIPETWELGYTGKGAIVAVVDTGVDPFNPLLADTWYGGTHNAIYYLPDGTPALVDFTGEGYYPMHPHGTFCACEIAGLDSPAARVAYVRKVYGWWPVPDWVNFTGVAPDAKIMGIKVLCSAGWGWSTWIMAGIEWAIDHGAHVVSMSLGGISPVADSDVMSLFVNKAAEKLLLVIAAGNTGPGAGTVATPGAAMKALTVGASISLKCVGDIGYPVWWMYVNETYVSAGYGGVIDFSSRGPTTTLMPKPDVVTPGCFVASVVYAPWTGNYTVQIWAGTSMSTPLVSGIAALAIQAFLEKGYLPTPTELKQLLKSCCEDVGDLPTVQGCGLLNAYKVIKAIKELGKLVVEPVDTEYIKVFGTGSVKLRIKYAATEGSVDVSLKAVEVVEGRVFLKETNALHWLSYVDEIYRVVNVDSRELDKGLRALKVVVNTPWLNTWYVRVAVYYLDPLTNEVILKAVNYENWWSGHLVLVVPVDRAGTYIIRLRAEGFYGALKYALQVIGLYERKATAISISPSKLTITAGETKEVTVSFGAKAPGIYTGFIVIESSGGEKVVIPYVHAVPYVLRPGASARARVSFETTGDFGMWGGDYRYVPVKLEGDNFNVLYVKVDWGYEQAMDVCPYIVDIERGIVEAFGLEYYGTTCGMGKEVVYVHNPRPGVKVISLHATLLPGTKYKVPADVFITTRYTIGLIGAMPQRLTVKVPPGRAYEAKYRVSNPLGCSVEVIPVAYLKVPTLQIVGMESLWFSSFERYNMWYTWFGIFGGVTAKKARIVLNIEVHNVTYTEYRVSNITYWEPVKVYSVSGSELSVRFKLTIGDTTYYGSEFFEKEFVVKGGNGTVVLEVDLPQVPLQMLRLGWPYFMYLSVLNETDIAKSPTSMVHALYNITITGVVYYLSDLVPTYYLENVPLVYGEPVSIRGFGKTTVPVTIYVPENTPAGTYDMYLVFQTPENEVIAISKLTVEVPRTATVTLSYYIAGDYVGAVDGGYWIGVNRTYTLVTAVYGVGNVNITSGVLSIRLPTGYTLAPYATVAWYRVTGIGEVECVKVFSVPVVDGKVDLGLVPVTLGGYKSWVEVYVDLSLIHI